MTLTFWLGGLALWCVLSILAAVVLGTVNNRRDSLRERLSSSPRPGRRLLDSDGRVMVGAQRHHVA